MIVTTPGLGECDQRRDPLRRDDPTADARRHAVRAGARAAGIMPGIKVDAGAKPLAVSRRDVTEGLDGLRERLAEYVDGRALRQVARRHHHGDGIPSRACIEVNAHALARYAALCQEAGLVPIVEPEVLMDGTTRSSAARRQRRDLARGLPSARRARRAAGADAAQAEHGAAGSTRPPRAASTRCRRDCAAAAHRAGGRAGHRVPLGRAERGSRVRAAQRDEREVRRRLPWALAFSFARAIQQPALELWRGVAANVPAAQQALRHRAECNRLARRGRYDPNTDGEVASTSPT